jgi:cell filamentation protein
VSREDPYVYPGTQVLRNRFGIKDNATLQRFERELVQQRIEEGAPLGSFDLSHLCAIHRHLFQDVYDWAGKPRTIEIAKGSSHFLPASRIEMGMADVHRQLAAASYHQNLSRPRFAAAAAHTIGDLNYVHPFREGNGRTQLEYLRQLGAQAGHALDLSRLRPGPWIAASKAAHEGDYDPMRREIARTL